MSRTRRGFTLIELLVVIAIITTLAGLAVPALVRALTATREATARHLIAQLEQAAGAYESDWCAFPAGDGSGSSTLATALAAAGPKGLPYFEFQPGKLDASGHVVSPVKDGDIIRYRNNAVTYPSNLANPSVHHKNSFDLWCPNAAGVPDAISNWE